MATLSIKDQYLHLEELTSPFKKPILDEDGHIFAKTKLFNFKNENEELISFKVSNFFLTNKTKLTKEFGFEEERINKTIKKLREKGIFDYANSKIERPTSLRIVETSPETTRSPSPDSSSDQNASPIIPRTNTYNNVLNDKEYEDLITILQKKFGRREKNILDDFLGHLLFQTKRNPNIIMKSTQELLLYYINRATEQDLREFLEEGEDPYCIDRFYRENLRKNP